MAQVAPQILFGFHQLRLLLKIMVILSGFLNYPTRMNQI